VSVVDLNGLTLLISVSNNIKASVCLLDIADVFTAEHKDLPPSGVSAPDLHVIGLT
jgi:hypothetical protein